MFSALSRSTFTAATRNSSVRCLGSTAPSSMAKNKNKNPKPPIEKAPPSPAPVDSTPSPVPAESSQPILSLDFSPEDLQKETSKTRASSRDTTTSAEKQRRAATRNLLLFMGVGALAHAIYMGSDWEPEELQRRKWTSETAPQGRWERTKARYMGIFEYFADPIAPELLPPPFPPPDNRPYVLVISLDDLLIHSSWDRQHGWRTAKRPGVDYFLAYLSQFYEIVLFTDQMAYTAEPILEQLDKYGLFITHRLFREATRSINGMIAKDLSYLNRDLSKVIVLDTNESHVRTHPENSVIVPKWEGGRDNARGLVDMIPFLEHIAFFNYPDVRPVLQNWQGKNIPIEYAKWEAEYKKRHMEKLQEKEKERAVGGSFSLGSLFSSQRHPTLPTATGKVDPRTLTFIELKRMQAQYRFLEEQKHLEKNREFFDKMLHEQQEQMKAQIPNNMWEMLDTFAGKPKELPPPGSVPESAPVQTAAK